MYAAILANVARSIALTAAEQAVFTALLVPRHLARHEILVLTGPAARVLTFVVQGCLRTYTVNTQAKEHTLDFSPEGWWCGNFTSVLGPAVAALTIQALEDTRVLQLSLPHLEQLCEQVPRFERFFRLLYQNGYLLAQRRLAASLQFTAEVRYAQFRRHHPQLHQRVAQKHIASFLGITPEFLSMLRRKSAAE